MNHSLMAIEIMRHYGPRPGAPTDPRIFCKRSSRPICKCSPMARSQPHTHVQPGMSTHGSLWLLVAAESATQSQPMVNDHSPPQVATLADLGCTWFYFLANFKASHRCVDADYRSFKKIQWGFAFVFSHFKHAYRISDADYRNFNKIFNDF